MASKIGAKIQITADSSQAQSDAKKAAKAYDQTSKAIDGVAKSSDEAAKNLKITTVSLRNSKDASKEAKRALSLYNSEVTIHGKNSKEARTAQQALNKAIDKAKAEYNASRIAVTKAEQALEKLNAEGKKTTAEYASMARAINKARGRIRSQELAVKRLAAQQAKLNTTTQTATKKQGGFLKTMGAGKVAMAGYAAAAVAGVAALSEFVNKIDEYNSKAQRLQAVQNAQRLTIDEARNSTKGLISDFELASLSNQALQLNVANSADKFAEFAEAAVKLGFSVGADGGAAKQVEDLVGALGRGSTELLDNLGISLKASEAQRIYAERLGKTVSQLDANERAEAFRVIGLERVIEASKRTNVELDGQGTSIQRVQIQWDNFLNDTVIPGVADATDATLDFIQTSPEIQALADIVENRLVMAWDLLSKSLQTMWAIAQPILKPFIDLAAELDLAMESFIGLLEDGKAQVVDFFNSFDLLPDAADSWVEEWGVMLVPVLNLVKAMEVALGLVNELTGARANQMKQLVLDEGKRRFDEAEERAEIAGRGTLFDESFKTGEGEQFGGGNELLSTRKPLAKPTKAKKKKKGKKQEAIEIGTAFEDQLDAELSKLEDRNVRLMELATLNREIAEEEAQFEIEAMQQRLELMELERELHGETTDQTNERIALEHALTEAQRQQAMDRGELANFEFEQRKQALEKEKQLRAAEAKLQEKAAKEAAKRAKEREKEAQQMATAITDSLGAVTVATITAASESETAAKKAIAGWAKTEATRMALVAAREAALAVASAASFNAPGAAAHAAAAGQAAAVAVGLGAIAGGVSATLPDETGAIPGVPEEESFTGGGPQMGSGDTPDPRVDDRTPPDTAIPISHSNADLGRPIMIPIGTLNVFGDSPESKADAGRFLTEAINEHVRQNGDELR